MTLDPLSPATTIDTLKTEQASSARADFLLAADRQGIAFARTDKPLGYSANLTAVPTIAGALAGDETQGIWLSGGQPLPRRRRAGRSKAGAASSARSPRASRSTTTWRGA